MLCRVVQFAAAVEHAARLHDVAGELEADAEQVMGGHQKRRIAGPLRLRHQLVGAAAVLPQIARDRVEQRDRPEDREQLGGVAELLAQLAGAGEDRLDLRARPPLHHPQRQPADHLQPQLVLQTLGTFRHPAQYRRARARRARAPRETRTARRRAARRRGRTCALRPKSRAASNSAASRPAMAACSPA